MITDEELKRILSSTLGVDKPAEKRVDESYKVEAKTSDLGTERLSEGNKKAHRELHEKYVEALNSVSAKLDTVKRAESKANSSDYRSLKIDETYNLNGAYLHDLYFENISDLNSSLSVDMLSYMRLQRDFGSFDDWQRDFIACNMASRCGWAITGYSLYLGRYINTTVDLHATNVPIGFIPVIIMDSWQHAYYRDYLNDVKSYTIEMMKELNWKVITARFKRVDAMLQGAKGAEVKNG